MSIVFICFGVGLIVGTKQGHRMFIREIYIGVAPLVEDSARKKLGGFGV